ncbi:MULTISPECIES: hypothetical protein [Pseudonocardia]|uniref:Uncharacterized protein n=2 Tax=Pseudonocardia TaxID=1847 RepID=A0A1Y2N5R4_PSEAH|nr:MULTISPECIES: hypothetical protein [Pseudonocardia]OSY42805.1 hypothetical protein BG845_01046 [Pseudonocardia autotrophica]TDN77382.1 hypothetical protein C8E95_6628 [Pseudonocardia autotrophica]BBG01405.1 hypothetical protein Pdca_26140 [Pseudonocardia autotrophica]GEC24461.1 hypothetical protein PSA01_14900 [Pseudonocardia saturnea]
MSTTPRPGPDRPLAARVALWSLAALLGAFAAFEMIKHGGWTLPLGLLGVLLPVAAGRFRRPAAVLDHPLPPVLVLAAATFLTGSQAQAAPPFTLGLTWLCCVLVRRALRPRRAPRRRPGASPA